VVRAGGAAGVARRYKGFARNGLSELPLTRIPVEALLIEAGQGLDEGRSLTRAKEPPGTCCGIGFFCSPLRLLFVD
jgi:hypothetical protein